MKFKICINIILKTILFRYGLLALKVRSTIIETYLFIYFALFIPLYIDHMTWLTVKLSIINMKYDRNDIMGCGSLE